MLKIKTVQKGKFPVVGFVKDPTGLAALYLGKQEGRDIVYWARLVWAGLALFRASVVSPMSKLTRAITKPKATWVEPQFYADEEYHVGGLLRASSFKGLSRR